MPSQVPSPALPRAEKPSDAELLDILYEILADDTGEDHGVSVATVEAFLHEHARDPKAAGSLAAFFDEHELSTDPSDYGQDPALKAVPSGVHAGFLPMPGSASQATAQPTVPELVDEPTPARPAAAQPAVPPPAAIVGRPERARWLLPTLVSLALMLGVVGAVSVFAALNERALERELSLSRLQLRTTTEAVDALRAEAQSLHAQLDAQRASEREMSEELASLREAERARQEREAARADRRGRRFRAPARRSADAR